MGLPTDEPVPLLMGSTIPEPQVKVNKEEPAGIWPLPPVMSVLLIKYK